MDSLVSQIIVGIFLLLLSGAGAFLMGRLTKLSEAHAVVASALAVALNDIEHLKEKAATHTSHIDALFEMKTMMVQMQTEMTALSKTIPQVMQVMQQMTSLLAKRAA